MSSQSKSKRRSSKKKDQPSVEDVKTVPSERRNGKPRRSSINIKDRIWEKEQLQDINLRFDYVLNNLKIGNNVLPPQNIDQIERNFDQRLEEILRNSEAQIVKLNHELNDLRKQNSTLTDVNNKLVLDKQNETKKLEEATQEKIEKSRQNADLLEKISNLKLKLKHEQNRFASKFPSLQKENERLKQENFGLVEKLGDLEQNFDKKLKNEINKNKRSCRYELDALSQRLGNTIDELKSSHDKDINELEKANKKLKTINYQLRDKNRKLENQHKDSIADIATMQTQINKLENQLKSAKIAHEEEIVSKDKIIRELDEQHRIEIKKSKDEFSSLKNCYNRLSHDYFVALDVKIELEREIKSLQDKLDKFEKKHGISTPYSKNKTQPKTNPKKRPSSSGPPIPEPDPKRFKYDEHHDPGLLFKTLLDDRIDRNNFPLHVSQTQFKGDWIGFDVSNEYGKAIHPQGWELTDKYGKQSIAIPSQRYCTKDVIRVVLKGNIDKNWGTHITPVRWNYKFDKSGDIELRVRDKNKNVQTISKIKSSVRKNFQHDNCYVM